MKVGSKVISVAASNVDKGRWDRWMESDFGIKVPYPGVLGDNYDVLIDGAKMSTDRFRGGSG
jgi:hypothetical protein